MYDMMLQRLDARDRALFLRWSASDGASRGTRLVWTAVTHLGGAATTIAAAVVPLGLGGAPRAAALRALAALVISHVIVRIIKQAFSRPRPSASLDVRTLIREPSCPSFPSGHAAAAMSIAVVYAMAYPSLAPVLIPGAMLVGASRIALGVHYPGDVLMGQLVAVLTAFPIVLLG